MQGQLPPEAQETVEELQERQEKAQQIATQRQQVEAALDDAESALDALDDVDEDTTMYREVGDLRVKTEQETAETEIGDRVDTLEVRVQALENQEEQIKERFDGLQQELQELMSGLGGGGGMPGGGMPGGGPSGM